MIFSWTANNRNLNSGLNVDVHYMTNNSWNFGANASTFKFVKLTVDALAPKFLKSYCVSVVKHSFKHSHHHLNTIAWFCDVMGTIDLKWFSFGFCIPFDGKSGQNFCSPKFNFFAIWSDWKYIIYDHSCVCSIMNCYMC